jgi:protein-tyrosine phosphatase
VTHLRYLFALVFAGLGAALLWKSLASQYVAGALIFGWIALDLFLVCIAYLRQDSRVFGKADDGTMHRRPALVMAPFLVFTWIVWQLQNLCSREPVWSQVTPNLFVGRRCPLACLPPKTTAVIDLTAEFWTPREIRRHTKVVCLPTLDGCAPKVADCLRVFDLLDSSSNSVVYVHCANGHGRSVTLVAALLSLRGITETPDAALQKLRECRPKASPNADQRRFLQALARCQTAPGGS